MSDTKSQLLVTTASGSDTGGPDHCAVWIREDNVLAKAREALAALGSSLPGVREIVLSEKECGVTARFGDLDREELAKAFPEADQELEADYVAVIPDPEFPVDSLLEEHEEEFGSAEVHVQLDCWYVRARFFDGEMSESALIPFAQG